MRYTLAAALAAFLCLSGLVGLAATPSPLETMKTNVEEVIAVLKDPDLKAPGKQDEKVAKLRSLADEMFDWVEVSKRTLARGWNDLNIDQRREFVDLYSDLLEKTYRDRVDEYSDEQVAFDRERMLRDDVAEVQTRLIASDKQIPVNYRLVMTKSGWKVYDVYVEGISLVQNYRKQFQEILAKESPERMLEILREKVSQQQQAG